MQRLIRVTSVALRIAKQVSILAMQLLQNMLRVPLWAEFFSETAICVLVANLALPKLKMSCFMQLISLSKAKLFSSEKLHRTTSDRSSHRPDKKA